MLRRIAHIRWDKTRLCVLTIFEREHGRADVRTSWGVLCPDSGSTIPHMVRFLGLLEVISIVPVKEFWTPNLGSCDLRRKIVRWEISLSHRTAVRQRLQKGVNDLEPSSSVLR